MKSIQKKQYTIRNLTPQLDSRLRQKSRETRKSLNEVALDALRRGAGLADEPILHHDLDPFIGTWKEDAEFEAALRTQDQVDSKMWQ